jgi:anhydro-N-acetylmuramic acid kinase
MRVAALSRKKELRIVGIMSGTSVDGIDFVLCKLTKKSKALVQISYVAKAYVAFPEALRSRLLAATEHRSNTAETAELHHELGRHYATELKKIAAKNKWKFDAIGLHGQTVFHGAPKATLQIGEPSYLSAEFSVPVISDFRTADLALGGQGAPIASLFHKVVFNSKFPKKTISLHNLGGISNLSLISASGKVEKAFDTGPANILMDKMISQISQGEITFDKDGKFSSRGLPAEKWVDSILEKDKFIQAKPPKSCGREEYGEAFLEKMNQELGPLIPEDKMATLCELTARSIAFSYEKFCKTKPSVVILCGGGAKNLYLRKRIQYHLPKFEILSTEDLGWPVDAIEGGAFALLAAYRIWDLPNNLPVTTGAKKSVTMGKISEVF